MTTAADHRSVVRRLLELHGQTYAQECGIALHDEPAPLFQLLVMTKLMGARIGVAQAVRGTRGLFEAGWTTPAKLADTTWRQRTSVLNRSGYARYDESTSTVLEELNDRLRAEYGGDLRRLRERACGDVQQLQHLLREFKGIGPVAADIFLREVQAVWDEVHPFVDSRAQRAARALGLPGVPEQLAGLTSTPDGFAQLVAALVRTDLARDHAAVLRGESGREDP